MIDRSNQWHGIELDGLKYWQEVIRNASWPDYGLSIKWMGLSIYRNDREKTCWSFKPEVDGGY